MYSTMCARHRWVVEVQLWTRHAVLTLKLFRRGTHKELAIMEILILIWIGGQSQGRLSARVTPTLRAGFHLPCPKTI